MVVPDYDTSEHFIAVFLFLNFTQNLHVKHRNQGGNVIQELNSDLMNLVISRQFQI